MVGNTTNLDTYDHIIFMKYFYITLLAFLISSNLIFGGIIQNPYTTNAAINLPIPSTIVTNGARGIWIINGTNYGSVGLTNWTTMSGDGWVNTNVAGGSVIICNGTVTANSTINTPSIYLNSTNVGSFGIWTNIQNAIAGEVDLIVGGTAGTNTVIQAFATGNVTLTQPTALLTVSRLRADNTYYNMVSNGSPIIDFSTTNASEYWHTNSTTTYTGITNVPSSTGVYNKVINLMGTNICTNSWLSSWTSTSGTNIAYGTGYAISFRVSVVAGLFTNVMVIPAGNQ